jgi:hypothetical protein
MNILVTRLRANGIVGCDAPFDCGLMAVFFNYFKYPRQGDGAYETILSCFGLKG